MAFITLAQAKLHCRIDGTDDDADLLIKISAAERAAIDYLQCNLYATQNALTSAMGQVTSNLENAKCIYDEAILEAELITDCDLRDLDKWQAEAVYDSAKFDAMRTRNGVVINDLILSAMMLILGWLYEQREDGSKMPAAAKNLLHPYRCYA